MRRLLALLVIAVTSEASGHDLWLEKEDGGFGLHYGHKYSDHRGDTFVEYPVEWVREVRCFDAAGAGIPFQSEEASPYRIRGDCAAVHVSFSSGYWTKTPYGTRNVPKNEARMVVESWLSHDSVKRIEHWSDSLASPLAAGLELPGHPGHPHPCRHLGEGRRGDPLDPPQLRDRREAMSSGRLLVLALCAWLPGQALAHDLRHQIDEGAAVSVRLFFADGSDFAFESYEVYRAGDEVPFQVGRTDLRGRVVFLPDRAGTWRIKAFSEDGHGADFSFSTGAEEGVGERNQTFLDRHLRIVAGVSVIFGLFGVVNLFKRRGGGR
jgi:hypothetical protein